MKIWVISDTHFGHSNILKFTDKAGNLIRGAVFKHIKDHDDTICNNWCAMVKPEDHVYHLGDVAMARPFIKYIKYLPGHKRLVRGNHDIFKTTEYLDAGFDEIYGVRVFPKANSILTHIPLHPDALRGHGWINIHGHTHHNYVLDGEGNPDGRYRCVSLEHTDYKPVLLME